MYRIGQEEKDAVARVIDSRELFKVNNGPKETYHFEEELKAYFNTKCWGNPLTKHGVNSP